MILVCGEALFDVFRAATRRDGLTLDARPGGSPLNVAVGLARLGQPAGLWSGVSRDWLGEHLVGTLAAAGVDTTWLHRLPRPQTMSYISLDDAGDPAFAIYGEGAADRALSPADVPEDLRGVEAVHTGSFAAVVEPVASAQAALLARVPEETVVSFDPNVRLAVEPETARWRQRADAVAGRADIIKASEADLAHLYPDTPADEIAAAWRASGAALVVVTHGERGATAWGPDGRVDAAPAATTVADTVGAGDAFQAALLAGLAETGRLDRDGLRRLTAGEVSALLAFAGAAAAHSVARRGAAMPQRHELPAMERGA
ncbi:fructokinase [Limimonas halophila]|uniref:Fructokinase n=1 Tax=Limimonas halophila TaxID=1082479 RepID=A0A1G7P7T8_9PROT|nr:carbohydrate kinase [Limimonas halophila]SDF82291.1 fructokinase [Limimonas halophila]